jgi:hypothetical protein
MASKQTRKSVSITGDAYWALRARCEKDGTSMSGVCEGLIRTFLELPERDQLAKSLPAKPAPKLVVATKVPVPTVVTTKELAPKTEWKPVTASRVEQIRKAVEAKQEDGPPIDTAGGIFTF